MFCAKCGHELPEGATFCPACGTQVGAVPAAKKSAIQLGNPLNTIKGFFKKGNQIQAIADAYQDKGIFGIIIMCVSVLLFALSYMVNFIEVTAAEAREYFSGTLASFLLALLAGAVVAAAGFLCVFLYAKLIRRDKDASVFSAINLTAYAFLPLPIICLLNMLLGLINYAIPVIFLVTAFAVSLVLYIGAFKKVFELGEENALALVAVTAIIVALAAIFFFIAVAGGSNALFVSFAVKVL